MSETNSRLSPMEWTTIGANLYRPFKLLTPAYRKSYLRKVRAEWRKGELTFYNELLQLRPTKLGQARRFMNTNRKFKRMKYSKAYRNPYPRGGRQGMLRVLWRNLTPRERGIYGRVIGCRTRDRRRKAGLRYPKCTKLETKGIPSHAGRT